MNTFDLLRKAADAAGYTYTHEWNREREQSGNASAGLVVHDSDGVLVHTAWNPLIDDAAAFRLAVQLGIQVFSPNFPEYHADGDACPAVRRAIVEAAVALGVEDEAQSA